MTVGAKMRWYIKIPMKLVLSRIPFSHGVWYRMGIFKHGKMQDFSYAYNVFSAHLNWAGLLGKEINTGKIVMELGPGESLFSALLIKAHGFQRAILLDVDDFSLPGLDTYKDFAQWLSRQGLHCPPISGSATIKEMLFSLDAQFLTCGLHSLGSLPDNSVDFIFSQAVLEHVRKKEFVNTIQECWRVLKPGGICTHVVDFKDHVEASLNNLRFSDQLWEADWMASSGFYTNRIRFGEMLQIFEKQGFEITVLDKTEWPIVPVPKKYMQPRFRSMSDSDLKVSSATIRLYKSDNRNS